VIKLNLITKFKEYFRVLRIAKKPEKDELSSTLRICMIGIGLIGLIGFVLYIISYFIEGGA
jgi:protein translocase SEC61 complex gamma subunit